MSLRILHLSDTHLGFSAYRKVDEASGLNQREVDVYRAFERVIDRALEISPEVVLHSGDLFDSVRPTNRALSFALDQLIRLSEADIPTVIISGNHSTPRLRETGSVLRVFEHLKNIYPVYKGKLERVEIGDLMVHALPHVEGEGMQSQLRMMSPDVDHGFNVAMMHGGVVGLGVFRMDDFNEQLIQSGYLRSDFDYIALGHYHGFSEVAPNAFYSGSTERFSFAEAGQRKGFHLVDLKTGERRFETIPTRPMLDLGPIEAGSMNSLELQEEMIEMLEGCEMEGKIVRLRVVNLPSAVYKALDFNRISDAASSALYFEKKLEMIQESNSVQWSGTVLDSLEREFVSFIRHYPVERVDKGDLMEKGLEYLKRGLEQSD
jgi:DNA repair protein SbcD/Mre11